MMARTLLGRVKKSRSGASAVEFGLALPVMLMMLLPAIDYGMAFALSQRLTAATAQAVQRVTANGKVQSSYASLSTDVASAVSGAVKAPVSTSITNWLECNGQKAENANGLCPSGQTYARYVQVTARTVYTPIFPLPGVFGKAKAVSGSAAVRVQ
ncbi:MAG: TadE/TadG family type IV pilus assembly protein [Polymorphobacter sp.]|uniref:TadE/TadG family type IV pilus assembly protein n=1 Tax=Polymorphobacter sp. TaxID=1909290 RepID=UPI003A872218